MEKNLDAQINLTRLIHVEMERKGKSGMIKGMFIPYDINLLEVDDYGVHLPIRILYRSEQDDKGQNGFVSKKIGSKVWKSLSAEDQEKYKDYTNEDTKKVTPILGNIKDWNTSASQSGLVENKTFSESEDLPF